MFQRILHLLVGAPNLNVEKHSPKMKSLGSSNNYSVRRNGEKSQKMYSSRSSYGTFHSRRNKDFDGYCVYHFTTRLGDGKKYPRAGSSECLPIRKTNQAEHFSSFFGTERGATSTPAFAPVRCLNDAGSGGGREDNREGVIERVRRCVDERVPVHYDAV
ncbi:hypothetical protein EVAR_24264_1 [Eumeta japonica]|uniref:Uncharacterized protein n=1 Tax=Eumeta variegata TaxID=151549 RepID=A0A4C1VFP4_EUMVA|nr:hypothetical protein EVAR_24264_1 [Eumeta japonica]